MHVNSEFTSAVPNKQRQKSRLIAEIHHPIAGIQRKPDRHSIALKALLSEFEAHGLDDLKTASLMHRVDTKFLLPIGDLEILLKLLAPSYTVLEIGNSRLFSYRNTYYDTSCFEFYQTHHNGKRNRFKIRMRHYIDSGDRYVEVKHKTNKSVTLKYRVQLEADSVSRKRINKLVSMPFGARRPRLIKTLVCSYMRIALADENNGERLTLDFNLSFRDPNHSGPEQSNRVLIAEVKRGDRKTPSVFMDLMNRVRQKPVSFSKYCIGCARVHSGRLKTNRFKTTLRTLDHII